MWFIFNLNPNYRNMPDIACQTDFEHHCPSVLSTYHERIAKFIIRNEVYIFIYLYNNDIVSEVINHSCSKGCNTIDYLSYSNIILYPVLNRLFLWQHSHPIPYIDILDRLPDDDFHLKYYGDEEYSIS